MKKITIDVSKCTGCGQCVLTCAFKQTGRFELTQANLRVVQWEDICLSVPVICQQCQDAQCIVVCPVEGLDRDPLTGAIRLDAEACIRCEACVSACTYQVMHLDPEGLPATCDLCDGNPQCVLHCYPGALKFEEVPEGAEDAFRPTAETLNERGAGRLVPPPAELRQRGDLA